MIERGAAVWARLARGGPDCERPFVDSWGAGTPVARTPRWLGGPATFGSPKHPHASLGLGFLIRYKIKRTDIEAGKFYIYGDLWEGFELDAKENIVRVISEHRDAEFGLPQVTLLESRSGKELASYGAFSGVTIK